MNLLFRLYMIVIIWHMSIGIMNLRMKNKGLKELMVIFTPVFTNTSVFFALNFTALMGKIILEDFINIR